LPFDPNTLMPLGFAHTAAATDSSLGATSMDSSSTSNNTSGGK
jgi:hypothetical protein